MKPLYKCDWCDHIGTELEMRDHEATCVYNKNLRHCFTCGLNSGAFGVVKCDKGVELPKGQYMRYCSLWEEKEQDPNSSETDNILKMFFRGY